MTSQAIEIIPGPGVLQHIPDIASRVEMVAPIVDWIQIDIADGILVPNKTPIHAHEYAQILDRTDVKFELHMMVKNPFDIVTDWVNLGIDRVIIHIESIHTASHRTMFRKLCNDLHAGTTEIGLAVDKETPIKNIYPLLDVIDCALIMTIAAGFSGQTFIPEMLDKVRDLRSKMPDLPIEVDGGITVESAALAIDAGVTRLAATSSIFNTEDVEKAITSLELTAS